MEEKRPVDKRFNETTSKREMFAAMALQGLLANPGIGRPPSVGDPAIWATDAVKCADALLEALETK